MSSNIPHARELLAAVISQGTLGKQERALIQQALSVMTRAAPVKRASGQRTVISAATRKRVLDLARSDLTNHQIAEITGLRSCGRVSEILSGKR